MLNPAVYSSWDPAMPQSSPARSYFYRLQPLAVRSPQVESLTSYLIRLAEAHDVTPAVLLNQELLPKVRAGSSHQQRPHIQSTFVYASRTLNGVAQCAQEWVRLLEDLTRVSPLRPLTMVTWSHVISARDLIRSQRAWCPQCFEDWRESASDIYESLLWSLSAASACPVHGISLETRCPHCRQEMHLVTAKSRPGCCSRCHRWLGTRTHLTSAVPDANLAEVATTVGIGELLSAAADLLEPPSHELFLSNLRFCIEDLADGSTLRLSVAASIPFDAMIEWTATDQRIRLSFLCRLCSLLGIPPLSFITRRITSDDFDSGCVRQTIRRLTEHIPVRRPMPSLRSTLMQVAQSDEPISLHAVAAQLGYSRAQSLRRRDPVLCDRISEKYRAAVGRAHTNVGPRRRFPSNRVIEEALIRALNQNPPPRLEVVTKELGFRNSISLYTRFPELCHAFATRNELLKENRIEEDRRILAAAILESPPPTLRELASRVHSTIATLKSRFPDLSAQLLALAPARNLAIAEQQRETIRHALAEDPPPSLKTVARRVGHCAQWLRRFDPPLAGEVFKRHKQMKTAAADAKRASFRAQIRAAVFDLTERGLAPSRRRVFASIANPTMRSSKILDRQIAATVLELKAAPGAPLFGAMNNNRFSAAGNHPLAAHKWNHDLAETAIGWS